MVGKYEKTTIFRKSSFTKLLSQKVENHSSRLQRVATMNKDEPKNRTYIGGVNLKKLLGA
jgi:hypothetical protein